MRSDYQSCHSYIRRPDVAAEILTPFYRDVVGLPVIRPVDQMVTFWAGEDLGFEIKCDDVDRGLHDHPETAQCLPVFRTHDLAATLARTAAAGFPASWTVVSQHATTSWVLGPDGHLTGFEQRSPDSPFAADREALRRWELGAFELPEVEPMAPDLHYLSRVVLRVQDVDRLSGFYAGVLGLDRVGAEDGAAVHSLGDTVLLVLAPGGRPRPPVRDRLEVANVVMTRVADLDAVLDASAAEGATRVGEVLEFFTGSRAAYLADPEGNLFGVQQRTLWGSYPEDVESDRRWQAELAGRTTAGAARV
ncbi:MAG TPA: VOC family protein [Mycobacteriales bacterium]|nr:VOC family protein [Mycobacteriales bacterium]